MNDSPYADPRVASVYNRVAAPLQFGLPARDLVRLLRLPDGARVLDVGTGTGAVALQASAEVGPAGVVIGIRFTLATSDYLLSSEAGVQGVALRRACPPDRWTDFTRRVADAFQSRFGDTVEYVRNVHFGIGTKRFASAPACGP